ncbi:hypothetical protein A2U01_0011689 [Trifolium medium]|uniref:Uncharacterized protein n=1 Tax=Trifolium medium TaxID=97028 RepID=A0A392MTC4_9FABA|nr:hypothetical protein [Trifolium medium]
MWFKKQEFLISLLPGASETKGGGKVRSLWLGLWSGSSLSIEELNGANVSLSACGCSKYPDTTQNSFSIERP